MVKIREFYKADKCKKFLGIPIYECVYENNYRVKKLLGLPYNKKPAPFMPQSEIDRIRKENKNSEKELLLVFTDSIGDYILIRNFFRELKKSDRYKDYKITLLGCRSFCLFAEELDSDVIDKFLYVDSRPEYFSNRKLKLSLEDLHANQGMKNFYDTIIYASFNSVTKLESHSYLLQNVVSNESIFYRYNANDAIPCTDFLEFTNIFVNYGDREMHVFDMYKAYFEYILGRKLDIKYPFISEDKIDFNNDFIINQTKEYVVINPCAYDIFRKWDKHNYAALIKYLKIEKGLDVILVCGGESERLYCEQIVADTGFSDIKIFSSLPVKQLLAILKMSKLYIGQDSGIFHLAAALDIRALCLSAGNAYFWFMNYPKWRKNIKVLFPNGTEKWIKAHKDTNWDMVNSVDSFYINQISVKDVIECVNNLLEIKEIVFVHKFKTKNTGDLNICPKDYFSEYFSNFVTKKFDIDDFYYMNFIPNENRIFIVGGGGLINQNDNWNRWITDLCNNHKTILWGVGDNQHNNCKINYEINLENAALAGFRDINTGYTYVPCVSCLSKLLDKRCEIKNNIVCVVHYEQLAEFPYPTMYNNQDFEELISFISEGEIILTNTYHVAYWSMLMCKKVILFNIFSSKFKNFKYEIKKYSGNIEKDIKNLKIHNNYLNECRKINLEFFEKVKEIIEDSQNTKEYKAPEFAVY